MGLAYSYQDFLDLLPAPKVPACTCTGTSTTLISAAEAGCVKCCAKFKEQAGNVVDGTTAMIQAAQNGHVDVVRLLVRKEAKMQDKDGRTALMDAARYGHVEIVKLLIPHEAKMQNNNGGAAIHQAASKGHTEIVTLLIPFEAKTVTKVGVTAMILAAEKGCLDLVGLLIPHEAKMQDKGGWTALMSAAEKGHLEIAKLLIPYEAKMTRDDGSAALMLAAVNGHAEIVQLLIPHEANLSAKRGWTGLMDAAREGYPEVARLLIPFQAKMQEKDGWTALMCAANEGKLEVVKLLVEHEAKMKKNNGWTALHMAASKGYTEIARLLIPYEAKITYGDGWTALMFAARNGRDKIVELLLKYEAGMILNDGRTATIIALQQYQRECLDLLLADEKERDASQIPKVMLSAYRGDVQAVLGRQHEWETQYFERTVFDFALLGNQRRVVKLLASRKTSREFFVRHTISRLMDDSTGVFDFISSHQHLLREIIPIVGIATAIDRSGLLLKALIGETSVARILRAICTPMPETLFRRINEYQDDAKVVKVLSSLKCIGFSHDGKTASNLASKDDGPVSQYLKANPLRQKQIETAKKEAEKRTENARQTAFREAEAESCFNRDLIEKARDAAQNSSQTPRLAHGHNSNRIRQKREVCKVLLLGAFRFMERVVREMLAE